MKRISKNDIEDYIIENEQWKESDIICPYCKHNTKTKTMNFYIQKKKIMSLNVKIVEECFC